jgi:hypothetical protein
MSSMIERMIQRTREPLSSVEPISPVRYAQLGSATEAPDSATSEAGQLDVGGRAAADPLDGTRISVSGRDSSDRKHAVRSRDRATVADVRSAADRRPGVQANASGRDLQVEKGVATPPASAGNATGSSHEGRYFGDLTTRRFTAQQDDGNEVAPLSIVARLRPAESADQAGVSAAPSSSRQQADADGGGPGPEITVTIGHIEVRAAPPPSPRPTEAQFRPRVSLADFLNQDQVSPR